MRLYLQFVDLERNPVDNVRLVYYVEPNLRRVSDLANKLAIDLELRRGVRFYINDFEVFERSPIEIFKDEEVVKVLPFGNRPTAASDSVADQPSNKERSSSSSSGDSTEGSTSDGSNQRSQDEPLHLNGEIQEEESDGTSESKTSSNTSTTSSEDSTDGSDAASNGEPCPEGQSIANHGVNGKKSEGTSGSSGATSSESSDSAEGSSSSNASGNTAETSSMETSETSTDSSSTDSSSKEAMQETVNQPMHQKKRKDRTDVPNSKNNSRQDTNLILRETGRESLNAGLPVVPPDAWPSVQRTALSEGDVVIYRIVLLQESEWRYGRVEECEEMPEENDWLLYLTPWPDINVHPDPKQELKLQQQRETEDEEEDDYSYKKGKTLEVPQSEYEDDGRLTHPMIAFLNLHLVDQDTVKKFQLVTKASATKETSKPNKRTMKRKAGQKSHIGKRSKSS